MRPALVMAVMLAALHMACCSRVKTSPPADRTTVRVGITGGMIKTGMWQEVERMFEAESGRTIEVIAQSDSLARVIREGKADLVTMHSCDDITDVVAEGYGINMRPWTSNEQVIIGPVRDPAKIRGLRDGAEALRRIAETQSHFVDSRHMSSRVISRKLWEKAGIDPVGPWVLKDESPGEKDVMFFAEEHDAYVIVGRKKMLLKKSPPGMALMVQGDPAMRRSYVVVVADPHTFPNSNSEGARELARFLVSEKVQRFLAEYGADDHNDIPHFHPLKGARDATK